MDEYEELDIQLVVPMSIVLSVRVTREELRTLSQAAEFHGEKLSTYIKRQALRAAYEPQVKFSVGVGR